ncbi:MAG: FOG: EAL domain [Candidatus Burkholderia crenata]|nr:MAG: FOG: EAL domain [Candidatus Burkholderia crenata]
MSVRRTFRISDRRRYLASLSDRRSHLCVTASIAAQTPRSLEVLCVDINWDVTSQRR